jgi:putative beta-lysine N-acetyltransferase
MLVDKIETIHGSVVQHGHHNDRIYLMHLDETHSMRVIKTFDQMVVDFGYGKIFAKIPASCGQIFLAAGYVEEARVPGFFNGTTDGLFVAKFFSDDRRKPSGSLEEYSANHRSIRDGSDAILPKVESCSPGEADRMAALYREVFRSYAFPIHCPDYVRFTMKKNVSYFCVRVKGELASLSAAEIDAHSQTCEMTDFATLPEHRGKGFAGHLLDSMETDVCRRGVRTVYTIARVDSPGMNRVFKTREYRFAGCLVKNTQIGGRIRSMNVWYKRLERK